MQGSGREPRPSEPQSIGPRVWEWLRHGQPQGLSHPQPPPGPPFPTAETQAQWLRTSLSQPCLRNHPPQMGLQGHLHCPAAPAPGPTGSTVPHSCPGEPGTKGRLAVGPC